MKSLIRICILVLCTTGGLMAQNQVSVNSSPTEKKCVPTKECAEKMGMTLEECKAVCQKVCGSKATAANKTEEANSNLVVLASTKEKSSCCTSIEECAKKMGMTVEECKAKCGSGAAVAETSTKVASASLSSDVTTEEKSTSDTKSEKVACKKSSKMCCAKKN